MTIYVKNILLKGSYFFGVFIKNNQQNIYVMKNKGRMRL